MKAIVLNDFGGVEQLQVKELPVPGISDGEVLVRVKAISINPVDVKTRAGMALAEVLKDDKPIILGWDISGVVTESTSPLFTEGDDVFGMIRFPGHGKAYADYVLAPAEQLALKPENTTHEQAAAATLASLTAWQAFSDFGRLRPGQRVLIHAAAGGVGHYAVQIARHIGAYVVATASAENRDFVLSLGANEFIDYKTQRFEEVAKDIDFVLDMVSAENSERSLSLLRKGGTLIATNGLSDATKDKAKARGIFARGMHVQSAGEDMQHIAQLLEEGELRSEVSKVFPFAQMADAHLQLETGRTKGKVVVVTEG
ncbi:MAG TPA: NADP-dependent oxidoreductase [Puia sp.]|jgi:NADPH:quinone reductase-like Zn-dependent oxidoreductase|nr:NADP-dependent oxidoreductase [Puia sp.]